VLDLHGNRLVGSPPDHLLHHVHSLLSLSVCLSVCLSQVRGHSLLSLNVSNNRLTSARLGQGFRYVTQLADLDLSGTQTPPLLSTRTINRWPTYCDISPHRRRARIICLYSLGGADDRYRALSRHLILVQQLFIGYRETGVRCSVVGPFL